MKVGFISLGCNKNLVDTEKTISIFKENNYEIVNNPKEAEIIVINTCGFIESAKEEAINTILEMAEYKKQKCKYLIAMGCLVERYKKELEKELPEVDLFIKYSEYGDLWKKIQELIKKREEKIDFEQWQDRVITTGKTTAYLKIADGCSNRCTYCAIPYIRGPFKSREFEEIIEEAKDLEKRGYKELILTAQDTTKYGLDLYKKSRLAELITEISKIDGIKWIRFLYSYPETIDEDLIKKLRKEIPDVIIRTTVMVGFPGETAEDYEELYKFVEKTKFDKMGAFSYSKEENTPAEKLKEQIHPATKKSRYNKIMQLQQKVVEQNIIKHIGKELEVLIENNTFDEKYYIGRSYMQAPEIDEVIYIKNTKQLEIGQFIKCKIIDTKGYDLIGEIVNN